MAIDTAEKRRSVSGVGFLPLIPGVTPELSKDVDWRQQAGWSYSGVAVDGEVADTGTDYSWLYVHMRRRARRA
jgi:hypothetical protein